MTVGMVIDRYVASSSHGEKKDRTQREDERKLKRIGKFFGLTRDVATLDSSEVTDYAKARRAGNDCLVGVVHGKRVGARTVQADLIAFQSALNWAVEKKQNGRRLLRENPLADVELPDEVNPRRPVMTHDVYEQLIALASRINPLLALGLIVAEGTGRRMSAWRSLRWDDIDFDDGPSGSILWRGETDKRGYEMRVEMTESVRNALLRARTEQSAIGCALVFPSPRDASKPCRRDLLDKWLRRAYKLSGIKPSRGGLWHPMRRKWATERKDYPVKDIADAGGWRSEATLLKCYVQSDPETIRRVVQNPTRRLRAG